MGHYSVTLLKSITNNAKENVFIWIEVFFCGNIYDVFGDAALFSSFAYMNTRISTHVSPAVGINSRYIVSVMTGLVDHIQSIYGLSFTY